jgi:carbonic anhydrase
MVEKSRRARVRITLLLFIGQFGLNMGTNIAKNLLFLLILPLELFFIEIITKYGDTIIMINQIIDYNRTFVAQKAYEKYLTDKYPDKKLAVLSCMDTRLTELLPAALGLKNGDAKIIKNAGGLVISAFDSAMRSLIVAIYELGVEEIMVVAHSHCGACHMSYDHFHHEMIARGVTDETLDTIRKCGIDLDQWLEGFKDTPTSVRKTVETIKTHPLVPKDIVVRGFIIDSETGALEEIQ